MNFHSVVVSTLKNMASIMKKKQQGQGRKPNKRIEINEAVIKIVNNVHRYFTFESQKQRPKFQWSLVKKRTAEAMGLSLSTVRSIINDNRVKMPPKDRKNKRSLDSFDKDLIVRIAYEFFSKGEVLTIKRLRIRLETQNDSKVTSYQILKALNEYGFEYSKDHQLGRTVLMERADIVAQRAHYLRKRRKLIKQRYTSVYLDETYVNANHVTGKQWHQRLKGG